MSLAIDVDKVTDVLLADGWHAVKDYSFSIDSYEYIWGGGGGDTLLGGGNEPLLPAYGFAFTDHTERTLCGPLTAVLAVKVER